MCDPSLNVLSYWALVSDDVLSGGESSGLLVTGSVDVASTLFVDLRVFTVGRAAILLMYSVVAEKVDPGIFDVRTKFSSSLMPVLSECCSQI